MEDALQFIDLTAQYAALKPTITARIQAVLNHGQYVLGPEVRELEVALEDYVGVGHAITCANGTDALMLALHALGVAPGDIVVTTPFTFFATVEPILLMGAHPVFVDIDLRTFNISPPALAEVLDRLTATGTPARAVISVDLFGLPADHAAIVPICTSRNIPLVEDAAQGFGGMQNGVRAGASGVIGTTSFFPAKPLGCYGDGGALFTHNAELAELLRSLRVHGKGSNKYDNIRVGFNSRLDTLQAAILLEKLAAFPNELALRQAIADRYGQAISNSFERPVVPSGFSSSWAQYCLLARDPVHRAQVLEHLAAADIPAMIYYPVPLHLQTALKTAGGTRGDFPVAEDVADRIFAVPMSPYLQEDDQARVIDALDQARAFG